MPEQTSPYAPPALGAAVIADSRPGVPSLSQDPLPAASATVAAFLSLLLPGLGHVYARQPRRSAWWIATVLLGSVVLAASVRAGPKAFFLVFLIRAFDVVGIRLGTIVDAAWVVRRSGGARAPVGTILLGAVLILAAVEIDAIAVRRFVVEALANASGSMIPTLLVGDHFFVDKVPAPGRGDLVMFPLPEHPEQEFVNRIVGLPGDRIRFRDGHPIVNDVEVPSCYVGNVSYSDPDLPTLIHQGKVYLERLGDRAHLTFYDDSAGPVPSEQGPYVVKDGEAFVVGDNRWNAHDSRMWWQGRGGGVPLATVRGVPFVVWLSVDADGASDWSRFGLALDHPHLPASMASLQPALDRCLTR